MNYCPSGYNGAACTLTGGDELALSYSFNHPRNAFTNAGSASGFDVTSVVVAPAGNPAKNRGIYFDGTNDGHIPINGLLLSHTFSFHSWVLIKSLTAEITMFSKDRNDFTPATDRQQLRLSVDGSATQKMTAQLSQDIDPSNYPTKQSTGTLTTGAWNYLVYSFELTNATTK